MSKKIQPIIAGKLLIGRHEWCTLPELDIPFIKAKIDTGAKTSAIHAFNIRTKVIKKQITAIFDVHPIQADTETTITCTAPIVDERDIMSSNGHKETRFIIQTAMVLGKHTWPIELSLSNRDPLKYRLLLGREALKSKVLIDPDHSSYQSKVTQKQLEVAYGCLPPKKT